MADSTPAPAAPVANVTLAPTTEVDEGFNDNDSSYGDEESSYTASLTSTIKEHTYENGRRYHGFNLKNSSTGYLAPNDEAENDRLDMHHHLSTLLTKGKLITAPIGKNPQRILDIGTGTGIWAIEAGDEYPSATVIGVDLSPTQPRMVPPNVKFEIDDVEAEWTYNEGFDYIHSRFMVASIANWPRYIEQIYKHTKPGGWVEFKDWSLDLLSQDDTLPASSPVARFHEMINRAVGIVGRSMIPGPLLKGLVTDTGFEKVKEVVEIVPVGLWARDKRYKEIGAWNMLCLVEGLEAISLRMFVDVLGMTREEVLVFLAEVRQGLKDRSVHAHYTYYIVTAQKPGGGEAKVEGE